MIDSTDTINEYITRADWRVNANANQGYSLGGLILNTAGKVTANYWLDHIYPPEIGKAHREADIHIHDLDILAPYTYFGKETVIVKTNNRTLNISFEQLYALLEDAETLLNKDDEAYAKYPCSLVVLDKNGWAPIQRIVRKRKQRQMHAIKSRGGRSIIVTDNHPVICEEGEVLAKVVEAQRHSILEVDIQSILPDSDLFQITKIDLLKELLDKGVYSFESEKSTIFFNGTPVNEIALLPTEDGVLHTVSQTIPRFIHLSEELGYLIGFVAAEGMLSYTDKTNKTVAVFNKDNETLNRLCNTLLREIGVPSFVNKNRSIVISNYFFKFLLRSVFHMRELSRNVNLPVQHLDYCKAFNLGLVGGVIDGDGSANNGQIAIRTSSRTLLEQIATLLSYFGFCVFDRTIEGVGSTRIYKDRVITQRYPLFGISFRKKELDIPSNKYRATRKTTRSSHPEKKGVWCPIVSNKETEIADEYIYDITTKTGTFISNGLWVHNCAGWSLRTLLNEGFNGVHGRIEAGPPKHLSSALGQMVNFLGTMQNEWAGAQAFSSFDTYIAPFVRLDNLSYSRVKQEMQEYIFAMNVPSRWGCVPPDTEILTADGWKKYTEIAIGDVVYGFNKETQKISPETLLKINVYQYEGEMVRLKIEHAVFQFNQLYTPNHRVFVYDEGQHLYTVKPANKVSALDHIPVCTEKAISGHGEYWKKHSLSANYCQVASKTTEQYKGTVWCPTTESGFWIARNSTGIHITGNSQAPFTNLTFDLVCPDDLKDQTPIIGGKEVNFTYGDLQAEMDMLNRAYIEVMTEGDAKGRVFTFPIPTYNITKDFDWESPNATLLFEMTAKYGLPYFQSFLNSELKPNMIRSMCCRLQLRLDELLKRGNGLFGSSEQTGSVGVVTINCARLGFVHKGNEPALYQALDKLLTLAKESLEIKRKVIQQFMDDGLYPYSKRYLGTLRNHFSTIGVNGIHEMIRNYSGDQHGIESDHGHNMALDLLHHIRAKMVEFQQETGHMYNLEATPAEATTHRFAKEDKKRYPDILQAGTPDAPYYTNSSQLPVGYTDDPFEALEKQDDLQCLYTGGCVEKGTRVITDKGTLNIEHIVENFKSLSPIHAISYNTETKNSEWDLITDAMSVDVSRNDKIRVVAEKNFNVVTSDWHPFFVVQKKPFSGKCPVCETPLASAKGIPSHFRSRPECKKDYQDMERYEVIEKRADQLAVGDYLLQSETSLFRRGSGIDDDLAYLLGFFISNGSIAKTIDNRGGNTLPRFLVRFFSDNREVLNRAATILNERFDCSVTPRQGDKRSSNLLMVSTSKKAVSDFFFSYGFSYGVKAYTVRIHDKIQQGLSERGFYSLLSGLIDGDGHINKRDGSIEYSTVSESLADDIVALCAKAGLSVGKYEHLTRRLNEVAGYRVLFPSYIATRIKNRLTIQKNKGDIKDSVSDRVRRSLPVARVLSTDKVSVEDNQFYDLTTEKHHNYLAGNGSFVFIHNTVLHLYMNERISSAESCKRLVRRALERFRLPYLTITPTFSICPIHGYLTGEHEFCPKCDSKETIDAD